MIAGPALVRLSPPRTLRLAPGAPAAIALNAVINFAFFSVDAFLPLAVTRVRHRAVGFAGLALTMGALSWTAGAWITARMSSRVAASVRVRCGFALVAVADALVLIGLSASAPIVIFPVAWIVAGLGMGLGYQSLALVVIGGGDSDEIDGGPAGSTVAARQIFDTLGTATGTGVAGAIVAVATASAASTRSALTVTFVLMIGVALFGAAVSGRATAVEAPVPTH